MTDHDTDTRNPEVIWHLEHQDGDGSDYNLVEIAKLLSPPDPDLDLALLLKCTEKFLGAPVAKLHGRTTQNGTTMPDVGFSKKELLCFPLACSVQ
jgi:hypothetical protein